jgi:hypothetical protein
MPRLPLHLCGPATLWDERIPPSVCAVSRTDLDDSAARQPTLCEHPENRAMKGAISRLPKRSLHPRFHCVRRVHLCTRKYPADCLAEELSGPCVFRLTCRSSRPNAWNSKLLIKSHFRRLSQNRFALVTAQCHFLEWQLQCIEGSTPSLSFALVSGHGIRAVRRLLCKSCLGELTDRLLN